MSYTRILGTGAYLPEKILTNHDLEKIVETTDEWIVNRTGIRERRIAGKDDTASTMAYHAAQQALAAANLTANDIDLIIVSTGMPDNLFPSTACLLQKHLGISTIPAFDIQAACAGFIYAMSIADHYIRGGGAERVLIVGSEVMSKLVDWTDRKTCVLFGDGAGAAVLGKSDVPGIISTHIHADGRHEELLYAPNYLANPEVAVESSVVNMQGSSVFKFAVNTLSRAVTEILAANNMDKSEIDWLVPHQANFRIIDRMAKQLQLPMSQVIVTLDELGNTSSASIPMALDRAVRDGRIQPGQTLLLEGFGGGFVWGSALIKY